MDSTKRRLLLVEDDNRLAKLISEYLSEFDIATSTCNRGDEAIAAYQELKPNLVVLDLMLPGLDGMEVCRRLKQISSVPILMLTARKDPYDQIVGLELGADDFVAKPVEPRVLLARVRALLRRSEQNSASIRHENLKIGGLEIHLSDRRVVWREETIPLRTKEFNLLLVLARQAGTVLDRDQILKELRGFGFDGFDRSVDNYICRLRRHFEDSWDKPERIKTIWGQGYLLSPSAW
ncbi:response regulator [Cupriavidus sp. 2TAF22]|uniref:response regulator n=1 Tax=unclassified Cupriavidus TaxID=2640874 RepID=UPI003F93CE6E